MPTQVGSFFDLAVLSTVPYASLGLPPAALQSPRWSRHQLMLNLEQVAQANNSREPLLQQSFFPATVVVKLLANSNRYLSRKKSAIKHQLVV